MGESCARKKREKEIKKERNKDRKKERKKERKKGRKKERKKKRKEGKMKWPKYIFKWAIQVADRLNKIPAKFQATLNFETL